LLRGQRQQLHARIGSALAERFPEIAETQPEIPAHHFTEAGLAAEAVGYWRRAGERAIERSANREAVAHLTRGIEVLKTLPGSPERDEQELMLQVSLAAPLMASKGWGNPDVEPVVTRALELCRQVGNDSHEHYRALFALAAFYALRGNLRIGYEFAEHGLRQAERMQDPQLLGYSHHVIGNILYWSGELAAARAHLERGIAVYEPERDRAAALGYGFTIGVACHSYLGRVLWHLGYPDRAVAQHNLALADAAGASHPMSEAYALVSAALLYQLRREVPRAHELADATLALATERGFPFIAALAMILRGWALAEEGRHEEGIARLREGLTAYRATGAENERSHWLALMAEACDAAGQIPEGLRAIAEAFGKIEQTHTEDYKAELYRLEGKLRLRLDPPDDDRVEASFRRAIETARAQEARSFELRAATSLARLWRGQGKATEARELLAPIYGWFTEGFDTADLIEAKALLDELA
jgi:predicted ATPase